jgi:hypothetical protein
MEKHCYKNHHEVIAILTLQYGFAYTGLGDNSEECFYKKTKEFSERVFVHPMFCSYSMDPSREGLSKRVHDVMFRSGFHDQKEQETAFLKLLAYLSEHSKEPALPKKEMPRDMQLIYQKVDEMTRVKASLITMAANAHTDEAVKNMIPSVYGNITQYQSTLFEVLSLIR